MVNTQPNRPLRLHVVRAWGDALLLSCIAPFYLRLTKTTTREMRMKKEEKKYIDGQQVFPEMRGDPSLTVEKTIDEKIADVLDRLHNEIGCLTKSCLRIQRDAFTATLNGIQELCCQAVAKAVEIRSEVKSPEK